MLKGKIISMDSSEIAKKVEIAFGICLEPFWGAAARPTFLTVRSIILPMLFSPISTYWLSINLLSKIIKFHQF
ncbi:hypothetical protein L1987_52765 [Smallanthus sonchifolius]|uniref:Uncharacterized protein n=1 Tax=Smallanthus sonchifolius TaxID=185202 RepID=A0ACB9EU21_9ASTR|nr:hypothetical protein L1987_52765 [Smallanthus sonchifolius]